MKPVTNAQVSETDDGRYLVINGHKWRKSDPNLSEERRQQLVNELMAARRAVKSAKSNNDDRALRSARRSVNSAKVALGERGTPWWISPRS